VTTATVTPPRPDVVADVTFPQWHVQTDNVADLLAIRGADHPGPGQVVRVEATDRGFTMEFEERWEHTSQHWYAREVLRLLRP
jgi:hypothetical protein